MWERNQTRIRRLPALFILGLACLLSSNPLAAETVVTTSKIAAYDCNNPTMLVGYFDPQTSLEVRDYLPEAKMYKVIFRSPDGKEVSALCQPQSLGKAAPVSSEIQKYTENDSFPPVFQSILKLEPTLWSTDSSAFALKHSSYGFKWVSSLDRLNSRSADALFFMSLPVVESIARFKPTGKDEDSVTILDEMTLLLYSKGDVKIPINERTFQAMLAKVESELKTWIGSEGIDAAIQSADKDAKRKSWFKYPVRVDMDWSLTRNATEKTPMGPIKIPFRAEYLRLTISPYDGVQTASSLVRPNYQTSTPLSLKQKDLKTRVVTESDGVVHLDSIPMVDQGQKGYCVVASVERVMRYYGLDIDQNEMAKVANSTDRGTSPDAMYTALKKLGGRFSLAVKELKHFDVKSLLEEVKDYNGIAKREHERQLVLPPFGGINVFALYDSMNLKILRQVGEKNVTDRTKFTKDITSTIDRGAPLLWTVWLGLVDEIPALPQAKGGHMRLIIGYNLKDPKKPTLIYTDSWGAGHEFKQMPIDDAFLITHGLYSIMPSS